ncbi:hypothetical protein AQUSIP_25360 [Aquicella siphonis]|uniref:2-oxoglutarate-dependent ethylene/succinate-forming enzyme n=1 Tax=Aquicella siphonis TaxID=254247 RepID=A0A5E4PJF2_9COXI|nr:2OG-Fe(II) oxygenase family protein [Aquicella siphonis]VVC77209.1 hypothetical protein AQUSIP_25360 [Aquicella siphonis]
MTTPHHNASQHIAWIDMHDFVHGATKQKIATARAFGLALQQTGFVAVTNIGLRAETISQAYAMAETYFAQPDAIKQRERSPDGHRGFIPFGTEHAKYTSVMDLKEFYQTTGISQPEALWPLLPGFRDTMMALYTELENALKLCLQATAIYLGYEDENQHALLSNMMAPGHGVMRILHYPPIDPQHTHPGALRSAPHEDISLMTIIPRATHARLQIKNRQGNWLDVVVPDNAAIINSGDTLSRITNGVIPSTTHRVINPPRQDTSHRYSIPFFGSLPFECVLRVLDKCKVTPSSHELPQDITFGDFLKERYQKIGLTN